MDKIKLIAADALPENDNGDWIQANYYSSGQLALELLPAEGGDHVACIILDQQQLAALLKLIDEAKP